MYVKYIFQTQRTCRISREGRVQKHDENKWDQLDDFKSVASYLPHRNKGYGTYITLDVTGIILIGRMLYQNKFICSRKAKVTTARLQCVCEARRA